MKKFKVCGTVNVIVTKEVWACSEEQAMEKAYDKLSYLTAYCGNGGYDKLIGVDGKDESVDIHDDIYYDDAEVIEDDPDYFECLACESVCEKKVDANGNEYWYCEDCSQAYDDDGDEFYPDTEEDEE
jgi:hypothetical protein